MSTIKVDTIKNTSNVEVFTAKAWVNFNGTGTVAIRGSGNVTSITDVGVGIYTVNFTTAMADANYSAVGSCSYESNDAIAVQTNTYLNTSLGIGTVKANLGAYLDKTFVNVAIFR